MFSRALKSKISILFLASFTVIRANVGLKNKLFDTKIINLDRSKLTLNIDNSEVYYISLYNVQGKEIRSLSQSYLSEGIQNLSFRGKGLPAGVYFVGLKSRSAKTIERFILK